MIDASSAKKSLKRFVGFVEEIMGTKDAESKEKQLSELISYVDENRDIIKEAVTEETSQLISYLVVDVYKSGSKSMDGLLEVVKYVDPENPIVGEYEIVRLLDTGRHEEVIDRVTKDRSYCNSPGIMDVLKQSAEKAGMFVPAVRYYSGCGMFDEGLFQEYAESQQDDQVNEELIASFEEQGKKDDLESLLEIITETNESATYRVKLAELYLDLKDNEKLEGVLKDIDPADVENVSDYMAIARANEYISDHARSLLFATSGLVAHPSNRDLMLQKARMLIMLRREGEATEALTELVENYPKDSEAMRLVASLYYKSGDYKNTLKYLGLLEELTEFELSDYLMLIDSRTNLSLFDEATKNINSAIGKFGKSLEILQYKLKLEKIINDQSKAYSTSLEILELDPQFPDAMEIKFNYLYDKEEYKRFVEELDEIKNEEIKGEFSERYAASLIHLNRLSDFATIAKARPEIMDSGYVLDAVFYTVRDDEKVRTIQELFSQAGSKAGNGMKIVLNRLLGVKPLYEGSASDLAIRSKSYALGYIVCMESTDFREKTPSEESDRIISNSAFKEISEMYDLVKRIASGKVETVKNLSDSPRLLYPVVSALIQLGDNNLARTVLDNSYDSKLADPFYYYYDGVLNFRKGNTGAARKSVRKALSRLSNVSFQTLEAEILLSEEDVDEIREALLKLAEKGVIQNINYEEVYNYVMAKGDYTAGESMVESLKPFNVDNFWLNKLNRDVLAHKQQFKDSLDFSSLVVASKKRNFEDIRKHVNLLEKLGMEKERLAFLISNSGKNESATIDLWIGDEYYGMGDYEGALEYYKSAIEKNTDPADIKNYADTLLETKNLEEAAKIIKHMSDPGLLEIKLYYEQGKVQEIIGLLQTSDIVEEGDEEKLTYIAENLWPNRLVRDALIKAYRSEGYRFLGRLISRKMVDAGDYESAAGILTNLLKNYPADIESVAILSDVYIQLGKDADAEDLLLNSMKQCKAFDESMLLVDRLMRIYYENRDYTSLVKFYQTNPDHVDRTSIQFVIRSYIFLEEFDTAEKLLGKYEGDLIDRELNREMLAEIEAKRNFSEILIYVRRLLKLEYKAGRTFDMKEALYKAEIPIERMEEVFNFLNSEEYYMDVNEEKYEILSRDVFQEIAKKTRVESLREVKINVIFNNLPSRDVIVAKNLYIYIKRMLEVLREPKTNDEVLMKLLRIALRDGLRPEPLNVAANLNVGISDALEVIALMKYMEDMNRKGGY